MYVLNITLLFIVYFFINGCSSYIMDDSQLSRELSVHYNYSYDPNIVIVCTSMLSDPVEIDYLIHKKCDSSKYIKKEWFVNCSLTNPISYTYTCNKDKEE